MTSSFFVNAEDEPADQDVTLTYDSTVSFIPTDVWRFDLQTARRYPDENPEVVVRDIFQHEFGGTVSYTPSYDLRINGRANSSTYTDGNERVWGQIEAARRVAYAPDVLLGARLTAFDFKRVLTNGYWNPDDYQSMEATIQSYGPLAERVTYNVQAAGGYAWTNPGEDGPVFSADGRLTYAFSREGSAALFGSYLITYARSGTTGGVAQAANDEPFQRLVVGGQIRLRW